MSTFISKSACRGNRPANLQSLRYYQRQRLVSRLIKERGVARFVVAPPGYGKTSLVLEYADTVFAFDGVFWINCKSPCFIRDLDEGGVAAACIEADPKMRLVVFEDVPFLDDGRSAAFSREIDALLNRRFEVLVTCVPSCDTLGRLQQDRVTISSEDLLVDDEELATAGEGDLKTNVVRAVRNPACRVPVLVWPQRPTAVREFLAQGLREEAPSDLLLALFCVAVLGSGSFDGLTKFGPIDRELLGQVATSYPHLGFDEDVDTFEGPTFEVHDIAFALHGVIDAFVRRSAFESREALVGALAGALMDKGHLGRACDIVCAICPRRARMTWVERNAYRLIRGACFLPLLRLVESMKSMGMSVSHRSFLALVESICRCMLGDNEGASRCAKRYAFDQQVSEDHRIIALVVMARCAPSLLRQRASEELVTLAAQGDVRGRKGAPPKYAALAQAWSIRSLGAEDLSSFWEAAERDGVDADLLAVMATWFYDTYAAEQPEVKGGVYTLPLFDCGSIERFVRGRVGEAAPGSLDFFSSSAGLAMESAHMKGMGYVDGPLPTASLIALRNSEMALNAQRTKFEAESAQSAIRREDWLATHPEHALGARNASAKTVVRLSVPTLNVRTFGHLELSIGGEAVDPDRVKGKNVRSLIVLLAASQGREVSRDALCSAMWPDSSLRIARKNFYSVWSTLRRALVLPDGSCPYLIRHLSGCSFDPTHVKSDISRFEAICRAFLFEDPDYGRWSDLLIELDRDFSSDLLPSESSNALVVRAREEYRTKLVDALVAASAGFVGMSNPRRAVWCAQMALDRDDTREDAYLALMSAQAASGQRSAAMATFRRGTHVLVEKLGLDPSGEMVELYQQLLESDDDQDEGMAPAFRRRR